MHLGLLFHLLCYVIVAGRPQNIMFILADDYGTNDIGYHGSEINTSCMDKLTAEGITWRSTMCSWYAPLQDAISCLAEIRYSVSAIQIHTRLHHYHLITGIRNTDTYWDSELYYNYILITCIRNTDLYLASALHSNYLLLQYRFMLGFNITFLVQLNGLPLSVTTMQDKRRVCYTLGGKMASGILQERIHT